MQESTFSLHLPEKFLFSIDVFHLGCFHFGSVSASASLVYLEGPSHVRRYLPLNRCLVRSVHYKEKASSPSHPREKALRPQQLLNQQSVTRSILFPWRARGNSLYYIDAQLV